MNSSQISGKWTHKLTGNVINVRDSVIDGDNMIIISDQGQIDMNDFSQYYIQTSDEIYDESGKVIDKKPVKFEEIKYQNQPAYQYSKYDYSNAFINNEYIKEKVSNDKDIVVSSPVKEELKGNFDLIDKLFKKKNYKPIISINIDSNNFPINELKMLMDIYDVDSVDIANYLLKEYINQDSIRESVLNYVNKKI